MKKKILGSHVIDAVSTIASENNINKEVIFNSIEEAFVSGAQKKYGNNVEIIAKCDRVFGNVKVYRVMSVVDEVKDRSREFDILRAQRIQKNAKIGDSIEEEIPSGDFDRVIVQKMGNIINSSVRDAKKEQEYDLYIDRVGEMLQGTVKSISPREIIIWIGSTEAKMDVRDALPNENFNLGDRINACIQSVNRDSVNPQIILSRKSNEFLEALLKAEVPECEDGLISIVAIAREPGFRSKIAVMSGDSRIDPVGACIGPKGVRVKAIMEQLKGEKIDIIEYSQDIELLMQRAIIPAKVLQIIINNSAKSADIIVDEENFSLAIGRRGQNVRLLSKLTGYKIDIMLESQKQERAAQKFNAIAQKISECLNLDEIVGQVLVASGFGIIDDVANAEISTLSAIEGFDRDVAEVIRSRAIEYINHLNEDQDSKIKMLNIASDVLELPILTKDMIIKLGESKIITVQDIADLASDELVEIIGEDSISENDAGDIVMIARRYFYGIKAE